MMINTFLIILSMLCCIQTFECHNDTLRDRKRAFSLFTMVIFPNEPCESASDSTMKGVCYSSEDCSIKGGVGSGQCASGFGVCCLFMTSTCGATVSQNCTYIQNPGFPSEFTPATACSFSVSPSQEGICQLRLDFHTFALAVLVPDGSCIDKFQMMTPGGFTFPTICGLNNGQHVYLDTGITTSSSTLKFSFGNAPARGRKWKIKVSQIECNNLSRAPDGCLQYLTGKSGTFKSFNFDGKNMLQEMQYKVCFRQEIGYCAMGFVESSDTSSDNFHLGYPAAVTNSRSTIEACGPRAAFLHIPATVTEFCGAILSDGNAEDYKALVQTMTAAPFDVTVLSKAATQLGAVGFNLVYSQLPC